MKRYLCLLLLVPLLFGFRPTQMIGSHAGGGVSGGASGWTLSDSDDFSGAEGNWDDKNTNWAIATGTYDSETNAGTSVFDATATVTAKQFILAKFVTVPGFAGFYFRSGNACASSPDAYALRYESSNSQWAWRYCGGGDCHSCTTIDDNDCTSQTLDAGDYVGMTIEGSDGTTTLNLWDHGAVDPGNDPATWGAATCTWNEDPGAGNRANSGTYTGVYEGGAESSASFDDYEFGYYQ